VKTSELIAALASDKARSRPLGPALAVALLLAAIVSAGVFIPVVHLRSDLVDVAASPRFGFKLVANLVLLIAACGLVQRLVRPADRPAGWWLALWCVPVLLAAAVALELFALPREQWGPAAMGRNALWCLSLIPLLGLAPLLAALWVLRRGAPQRPAVAGAVAGLLAAGVAGSIYALHCTDDSPLFLTIWYGLAASVLTLLGAALGSRWLRW
jgi:hypothetical protein